MRRVTTDATRQADRLPGTVAHGLMLVGAAALIWSTGGLIVRLLDSVDTWTTVFWRSFFAALFLAGFILLREGRGMAGLFRDMGRPGILVGVCFAVGSASLVIALNLTSVAHTLVILSTAPLVAALLARVVLGETVRRRTWLAMAAALVGVAVMVSDTGGRSSLAGDLVAAVIACAIATATVTIRRHRGVRMTPAACLGATLAALVALPLASPLAANGHDMGLLVVFGALQFGGGMALYVTGARMAPAAEVSLIALLEPILGPVWVWLALGHNPGTAGLIGGGTVIAALVVHTLLDLRSARPAPPVV